MGKPTLEDLEGALKDTLFYIDLAIKEIEEKGEDKKINDWAYNIRDALRSDLGREHYGFGGWDFYSVFYIWLVIEVWKDGRIVPRCVTLTEKRAEYVKDRLIDLYERKLEPSKRPKISIEHQRTEHIFGFEMQNGRVYRTSDTFAPSMTEDFEVEKE